MAINKAINDIINRYNVLDLPKVWGSGNVAAADGTKYDVREQNLLSEYHIRYGGYGGIAYHHVADKYIALFSHFIPCGTWEAVYIIEGLLKNKSELKPNQIHADTQGQSTPVFALSYLLGIKLMPRIRNWKDLIFYRHDKNTVFLRAVSTWLFVTKIDLLKRKQNKRFNCKCHGLLTLVSDFARISASPQAKPQVPATEKQLITEQCNQFIETELKPKYIQPPTDKSWQYIEDIFGKWYRNFYYFCGTSKLTDPDRISESFEEKYARLEYVAPDKFNLAYFRHTGQWWEFKQEITLEKCLEEIKTNPILHPC